MLNILTILIILCFYMSIFSFITNFNIFTRLLCLHYMPNTSFVIQFLCPLLRLYHLLTNIISNRLLLFFKNNYFTYFTPLAIFLLIINISLISSSVYVVNRTVTTTTNNNNNNNQVQNTALLDLIHNISICHHHHNHLHEHLYRWPHFYSS